MQKIAVLSSGGDAPGMNAAIRAVVRNSIYTENEVYGVGLGFNGLIENHMEKMTIGSVADIIHRGGTILKTSRCEEFKTVAGRRRAGEILQEQGIENLIVIGGNGSIMGGYELSQLGINVIAIPATIDNDIYGTQSIGFDTAVNTAVEAINRIRDTASSHGRIFIIEVMGRHSGEIALAAGVAGGAESILIPEIKPDIEQVIAKIDQGMARGKLHSIIIVAEGAYSALDLKQKIEALTRHDTRISILGHIQRGGNPTAADRILASCMGKKAVDLINAGQSNLMVAGISQDMHTIPLPEVIAGKKELEWEMYEIAKVLSI
jgi:6-phosphofructokinase 1